MVVSSFCECFQKVFSTLYADPHAPIPTPTYITKHREAQNRLMQRNTSIIITCEIIENILM